MGSYRLVVIIILIVSCSYGYIPKAPKQLQLPFQKQNKISQRIRRPTLDEAISFSNRIANNITRVDDTYKVTQCIRILGERKQLGAAISLFQSVSKTNISINVHHFAALLQACRLNRQADIAEALFDRIDRYGLSPSSLLCNIMQSIYADAQKTDLILSNILMMKSSGINIDAFTLSSSINGCVKSGDLTRAHEIVNMALTSTHFTNTYVFNAILSTYAAARKWKESFEIYHRAISEKVPLDTVSYSILINTAGEARQFDIAVFLFESMIDKVARDTGTYNSLMTACERCKRWTEAKELLNRMKTEGVRPDVKTICSAIACYGGAGQWKEAMQLYHEAKQSGLRMDKAVYNSLINCLQSAGKLTLAVDVIREGSADFVFPAVSDDTLNSEEAFRLARDVYAQGIEEGTLGQWTEDDVGRRVLDLHTYPLSVAITLVSLMFEKMRAGQVKLSKLRIITGRGNHINNSGTRGVLRAEIEMFLLQEIRPTGLLVTAKVEGNEGCIDVTEESIREWVDASQARLR